MSNPQPSENQQAEHAPGYMPEVPAATSPVSPPRYEPQPEAQSSPPQQQYAPPVWEPEQHSGDHFSQQQYAPPVQPANQFEAPVSPPAPSPPVPSAPSTYGEPQSQGYLPAQPQGTYGQAPESAPVYANPVYVPQGQPATVTPKGDVFALVSVIGSSVGLAAPLFILLGAGFMGFLTGWTSVVGVIFGHLALSRIKREGGTRRGMALAGMIMGYVGVAIGFATLLFILFVLFIFGAAFGGW